MTWIKLLANKPVRIPQWPIKIAYASMLLAIAAKVHQRIKKPQLDLTFYFLVQTIFYHWPLYLIFMHGYFYNVLTPLSTNQQGSWTRLNGLLWFVLKKKEIRLKRGLENLRNIWQLDKTIFLEEEKEEAKKWKQNFSCFDFHLI